MKNDYTIRLEKKEDYRTVENLTREAFWNVYRPGCNEHYVLHCFRESSDFIKELDFVMEKDSKIIGHIMYVHSEIKSDDGKIIPIVTFGPVSISPSFQGQGYGKALIQYSMDKAKEMGFNAIGITGNIKYYGRFGFVMGKTKNIRYAEDPDAVYFFVKELKEGFLDNLSGTYKEPDGYFVDDKELELFDSEFPPKQKLKLPNQLC